MHVVSSTAHLEMHKATTNPAIKKECSENALEKELQDFTDVGRAEEIQYEDLHIYI